jgi:hypothetical protein
LAIAWRIALEGWVTVSLRKSILFMISLPGCALWKKVLIPLLLTMIPAFRHLCGAERWELQIAADSKYLQ